MASAKIVRLLIGGEPVEFSDLEIDPIGKEIFRITIRGRNYPEKLRQTFGMGSSVTVVSSLDDVEVGDVFVVQDAPGGSEEADGSYALVVETALVPRAPRS